MLVTDDHGESKVASAVRLNGSLGFDTVRSVGSMEARVQASTDTRMARLPEFEATREVVGSLGQRAAVDAASTADKWRARGSRPSNVALRVLRASKVEAIGLALALFERVVFLDADTYVCSSLQALACALDGLAIVAFVPVEQGREHGTSLLRERWAVPRTAREANTGVLAVRNDSRTWRLLDTWRKAYKDISKKGFLMDQPAFRAALHVTQVPLALLSYEFNCRGHQRRSSPAEGARSGQSTAVPLRCDGFARLDGPVQTKLKGGAGCLVLHSHDIQEDFPIGIHHWKTTQHDADAPAPRLLLR